jgi:ABC transporter substrate binding protein
LVRSQPDLIVTTGLETSLQAVVGASGFVPVVMIAINFDPLARGYIPSLARPGGNITGLVFQQLELAQKQVELLTGGAAARPWRMPSRPSPARPGGNITGVFLRQRGLMSCGVDNTAGRKAFDQCGW